MEVNLRALAAKAVAADKGGQYRAAYALYYHLADALLNMAHDEQNAAVRDATLRKATEYINRAVYVKQMTDGPGNSAAAQTHDNELDHVNFLLQQGLDSEAKGDKREAYAAYASGCELALIYLESRSISSAAHPLSKKVVSILSRMEQIKPELDSHTQRNTPPSNNHPTTADNHPELSPMEMEILKSASYINSRLFLPWMSNDKTEPFSSRTLFSDPDGMLVLSREQKQKFGCWKRVSEIMKFPTMIAVISSTAIVQDVVTDCSFVASLCVSAAYELKFNKQLITACVFPQDFSGYPIFNPIGKYVVKLFYNGIARMIVVDDFLPLSSEGALMCTYSTNSNEIWPSIIEKAYMKLNGGYDFPGSNSGIDLYALTGWIPEQIFIRVSEPMNHFQWSRLYDGFHNGTVLLTIATIAMSDEAAEALGLVSSHAYAVLDLQLVAGIRMLQLKNPWNHRRWNGKYSHNDRVNWTREFKNALNFDQLGAMQLDDGIFWIDFDSVRQHFESIHANWNPEIFKYQHVMHVAWPRESGPAIDTFTLAHNPQYGIEVNAAEENSSVWLLLSKHVTTKEENKDYITLHVYADTNCKRVYYPEMYKVLYVGVYVNNPHVLATFTVPKGVSRYTAVVSQHEKTRSLTFSLRAYATHSFLFGSVRAYSEQRVIRGALGFVNDAHVSHARHNLKFTAQLEENVLIMVEEEGDALLQLQIQGADGIYDSGAPRQRFAFIEKGLDQGMYIITVSLGAPCSKAVQYRLTFRSFVEMEVD
ncbi:calpain 7 [Chytriomyces hyalinus]|nr:calpain 7 [Chytriomyces hyalinus]